LGEREHGETLDRCITVGGYTQVIDVVMKIAGHKPSFEYQIISSKGVIFVRRKYKTCSRIIISTDAMSSRETMPKEKYKVVTLIQNLLDFSTPPFSVSNFSDTRGRF
jgi:hypothetical protein